MSFQPDPSVIFYQGSLFQRNKDGSIGKYIGAARGSPQDYGQEIYDTNIAAGVDSATVLKTAQAFAASKQQSQDYTTSSFNAGGPTSPPEVVNRSAPAQDIQPLPPTSPTTTSPPEIARTTNPPANKLNIAVPIIIGAAALLILATSSRKKR